MNGMKISTKVLIFLTLAIYIIHLVFNALSARGGPRNKLFPNTVSNISKRFHLEITPVGATFSIWGAIFAWQVIWILYTVSTVFRSGPATNILQNKFFIAFIANILTVIAWLFTWARAEGVISFVIILLGQIFLDAAIAFACYDLRVFLDDQKVYSQGKVDIWSQRFLVQNGLLFYGTWTTIATLINTAVVFAYYIGTSTKVASLISLSLLGVLAVTWFMLENFVIQKYAEYTFSAYITLIIGLTGILVNIFNDDKLIGGITLGLLILSGIFLIARIIIISVQNCKKLPLNESTTAMYQKNQIA